MFSNEMQILDKNMDNVSNNAKLKTGYTLRLIFANGLIEPLDYKLSIRGDVLSTGELSRDNAKMIAKHIIDKNVISGKEYLLAADYDGNGQIKMNDVVKLLMDMHN